MKKIIAIILLLLLLAGAGYLFFRPLLQPEEFIVDYFRRFDPEVYTEQTKDIVEEIYVKTGKYKDLAVLVQFKLESGEVDYEVTDPKGNLVLSDHVSDSSYEELLITKPMRGTWKFIMHTTEDDRGVFRLVWVDGENLEIVRNWQQLDKSGVELDLDK